MKKLRMLKILIGVTIALLIQATLLGEINNMLFALAGYETLASYIWIPEVGLSAKDTFIMIYFAMLLIPIPTMFLTWFLTKRDISRIRHQHDDKTPPAKAVIPTPPAPPDKTEAISK